jgi:hypothetical protein
VLFSAKPAGHRFQFEKRSGPRGDFAQVIAMMPFVKSADSEKSLFSIPVAASVKN